MKIRLLWAMLALVAIEPASAGQIVTYRGEDGRNLILEIGDNGDSRVAGMGQRPDEVALIVAGELYLVEMAAGAHRVVRLSDLAAVTEEALGPMFKGLFSKLGDDMAKAAGITIRKTGSARVGQYAGEAYSVVGLDRGKPGKAVRWIASRDPALGSAGRAMQQFVESTLVLATPFLGPAVPGMVAENRQLFALGTPLDAGGKFTLVSVVPADIDPARLKLPAEPMSRAALLAELKTQAPAGN
jgi:hypothetical protein